MLDELIDKRIAKSVETTQEFAEFIRHLFDEVDEVYSYGGKVGGFTINKKDFKKLGKFEVPCFYHITDDNITIFLDYSFILGHSFDNVDIIPIVLENELKEKEITFTRTTDHLEYESKTSVRTKDIIIFQKRVDAKIKKLT